MFCDFKDVTLAGGLWADIRSKLKELKIKKMNNLRMMQVWCFKITPTHLTHLANNEIPDAAG